MDSPTDPMLYETPSPPWLSKLQISKVIGKGAFGIVCRATTPESPFSEEYAVKLAYLPDQAIDTDLRLLQREAKIKPSHRNIVRFYETSELLLRHRDVDDLFQDIEDDDEALESLHTAMATSELNSKKKNEHWNGIHVFVHKMELCNYSLRRWIDLQIEKDKEGSIDTIKLYSAQEDILRGINEGLLHLHLNNIIHRDLKTENILIKIEGTSGLIVAKIADFSIGRINHDDDSWTNELTKNPATTKMYMAPELMKKYHTIKGHVKFNSNKSYSLQCDLFSLGFIYVELLQLVPTDKRQHLFTLLRDQSQALSLIKDHPRIPSTKPVILRLLQNDTNLRLKSVQEVQQMLDQLLVSSLRQLEIITSKGNADLLMRYEGKIKLVGNIKSKISIPSNIMLVGDTKVWVDEILLDEETNKCTIKGIRANKIIINGTGNTLSGIEVHRSLHINGDGNIAKDIDFDFSQIPAEEVHECGVEITGNNNTLIDVGTKQTRYVDTGTANKISHIARSNSNNAGGGRPVDSQFFLRKSEFERSMVYKPMQNSSAYEVASILNTKTIEVSPFKLEQFEVEKMILRKRVLRIFCIVSLISTMLLTGVGFGLWHVTKYQQIDVLAFTSTTLMPKMLTTLHKNISSSEQILSQEPSMTTEAWIDIITIPEITTAYDTDFEEMRTVTTDTTTSLHEYSFNPDNHNNVSSKGGEPEPGSNLNYFNVSNFTDILLVTSQQPEGAGNLSTSTPDIAAKILHFIFSAKHLTVQDTNGFIVDPFIRVFKGSSCPGSDEFVDSEKLDDEANPQWNKVFNLLYTQRTNQKLWIQVWDRDVGNPDDIIGDACIDVDEYVANGQNLTVPLSTESGTVTIQNTTPFNFTLAIMNIPALDGKPSGLSDPFVKCYYRYGKNGSDVLFYKTKVVDNTETASWDNPITFENYQRGMDQFFHFDVRDSDGAYPDDDIGFSTLEVDSFVNKKLENVILEHIEPTNATLVLKYVCMYKPHSRG